MNGLWILTVISLAGVIWNILKDRRGFLCWMFSNAGWFLVDLRAGLPEQAFLFGVYFILAVFGWFKWDPKNKGGGHGIGKNNLSDLWSRGKNGRAGKTDLKAA